MRMQHGLGPPGGAGGIENQFDGIGGHRLRHLDGLVLREHCLVAIRTCITRPGSGHPHLGQCLQLRQFCRQAVVHGGEVEAAVVAGEEHGLGRAIGQYVAHLGITVNRHDRHDHQPKRAGRQVDHGRFSPVGQLKRQHIAGHQPPTLQGTCQQPGVVQQVIDPARLAVEDVGNARRVLRRDGQRRLGDGTPHPLAATAVTQLRVVVQAHAPTTDVLTHAQAPLRGLATVR
ncbi:hypothetical protein D9M71_195200 [compost metagenome]